MPVLRRYNVPAVFSGHVHLYERHLYKGIQFVTTGLSSYHPWTISDKTASRYRVAAKDYYHYCRVRAGAEGFRVEVIGLADKNGDFFEEPVEVDRFSIVDPS